MKLRSVDVDGRPLGRVMDVRLEERDGGWVVTHVVVGRAAVAQRLGFIHGVVDRPVLLARLLKHMARHARVVPWDEVSLNGDGPMRVASRHRDLKRPGGYP